MLYLNFYIDLGHKYVSKPMLFLIKGNHEAYRERIHFCLDFA